ncbi:hypothetical protein Y032_1151g3696 [Ancylostoma ceylanicum]|uniref:Uncharacterized protein n=1 Tax=Ancylostoma ceylanicum TaxID=53326 RepID=A0A016W5K9_9BILA|nr:hypothetical protein Y032_1151g3696 [Ancylostoma ceylanicum]
MYPSRTAALFAGIRKLKLNQERTQQQKVNHEFYFGYEISLYKCTAVLVAKVIIDVLPAQYCLLIELLVIVSDCFAIFLNVKV